MSEKVGQLKIIAQDGKYRMTDVVDIEGMFRIIELIPSKNAEPIKQWLAKLDIESIDEMFDSLKCIKILDNRGAYEEIIYNYWNYCFIIDINIFCCSDT